MKGILYYNSRLKTYYETVYVVSGKNLKVRYRNSIFGFFWTLINPLFMLSIFILVLGNVIEGIDNYPLYVLSGLVFWNFFTTSTGQIISKILESGSILKSVKIPAIIFPLSTLFSNLVNFILTFIVFFILMIFYDYRPSPITLLIIPSLVLFVIFTFGVSLTLATLNVYFRDVEMFWTTISPALFYATPVVYMIPSGLTTYMMFNPFAYYMVLFREILYYSRVPEFTLFLYPALLSFFFLGLGLFTYYKLKKGFISNF